MYLRHSFNHYNVPGPGPGTGPEPAPVHPACVRAARHEKQCSQHRIQNAPNKWICWLNIPITAISLRWPDGELSLKPKAECCRSILVHIFIIVKLIFNWHFLCVAGLDAAQAGTVSEALQSNTLKYYDIRVLTLLHYQRWLANLTWLVMWIVCMNKEVATGSYRQVGTLWLVSLALVNCIKLCLTVKAKAKTDKIRAGSRRTSWIHSAYTSPPITTKSGTAMLSK